MSPKLKSLILYQVQGARRKS